MYYYSLQIKMGFKTKKKNLFNRVTTYIVVCLPVHGSTALYSYKDASLSKDTLHCTQTPLCEWLYYTI
jgi:hypothetical protein